MNDRPQLKSAFEKFVAGGTDLSNTQITDLARKLCETADPQTLAELLGSSMQKVADIREDYRQALRQARMDNLTGIANRARFSEKLHSDIGAFQRGAKHLSAIIYIDLDDFKPINDTYGHNVGDEALKTFAQALQSFTRDDELAARLGGDEFALIIREETGENPDFLNQAVERLKNTLLGLHILIGQERINLKASISGAIIDKDLSAAANLDKADRAMYAVKSQKNKSHLLSAPGNT